jgi:hypothetical protein
VLVHLRRQLVQRQRARRVAPDLHGLGAGDAGGDPAVGVEEEVGVVEPRAVLDAGGAWARVFGACARAMTNQLCFFFHCQLSGLLLDSHTHSTVVSSSIDSHFLPSRDLANAQRPTPPPRFSASLLLGWASRAATAERLGWASPVDSLAAAVPARPLRRPP